MARKNYSEEFRRQAVDLYESTPGATLRGIAADLGIERDTLAAGSRRMARARRRPPTAPATGSPCSRAAGRPAPGRPDGVAGGGDRAARGRERAAARGEDQAHDRAGDPAQGGQVFRRGDALVNRFQFVADHRRTFGVKRLCSSSRSTRSSFYSWLRPPRPPGPQRAAADAALAARIRVVHDDDGTYGAPRITAELNDGADAGARVNHKRVARVMRAARHRRATARRRVRTTVPEPADQKAPDLIGRDFTAAGAEPELRRRHHLPAARRRREPLPGDRDRLLLPPPGRLGDRRPHAHRTRQRRPNAAAATRGSLAGAIMHTDHGSVHLEGLRRLCAELGVTQSMGAVGSSADNASPSPSTPPSNARSSKTQQPGPTRHLPPPGLPLADPLQHPPPPLLVPLPVPEHLRNRYPATLPSAA